LEKWADPRVVDGLRGTFSHYDEADIRRGLTATTDLFRKIAIEVAEKLNYTYPAEPDRLVTKWIKACLSGKV